MNEQAVDAPVLPQVPRPATSRARRRSWTELPVRIWIILSITIALMTILFTVTRVVEAIEARWLIQHGTLVDTKFVRVVVDPVKGHGRPRAEPLPCTIAVPADKLPSRSTSGQTGESCKVPGIYRCDAHAAATVTLAVGNTFPKCEEVPEHATKWVLSAQTVEIRLEPKAGASATVGDDFRIRIDPNDPSRWTELTEPVPWSKELRVLGVLGPLLLVLLGMMMWRRSEMLKVWRDQPLVPAVVVETRQTAVAPLSRIVRFTFSEGDDRRVHATLMPARAGIPGKGETIWLICPPDKPSRAIVAELYV